MTVCPECFFYDDIHKGHSKEIAKVVFEEKKAELEEEMKSLDKSHEVFTKRG